MMNSLTAIMQLLQQKGQSAPNEMLTMLGHQRPDLKLVNNVTEQEFWHFTRQTPHNNKIMSPGNSYHIGVNPNPFFEFMLQVGYEHEKVYTNKYINDNRDYLINNPELLYKLANESLKESTIRNRELALALIRCIFYNDKPSMLYGIWLMDSPEMVQHWEGLLSKESIISSRLIRVKATGNAFRANASTLYNATMPLNVCFLMAHSYWRGNVKNDSSDELVFEGTLDVLEYCD